MASQNGTPESSQQGRWLSLDVRFDSQVCSRSPLSLPQASGGSPCRELHRAFTDDDRGDAVFTPASPSRRLVSHSAGSGLAGSSVLLSRCAARPHGRFEHSVSGFSQACRVARCFLVHDHGDECPGFVVVPSVGEDSLLSVASAGHSRRGDRPVYGVGARSRSHRMGLSTPMRMPPCASSKWWRRHRRCHRRTSWLPFLSPGC